MSRRQASHEETLSRLAVTAELVRNSKRSSEMIGALLEYLKRFEDKTLQMPEALPIVKIEIPEHAQATLSLKIGETPQSSEWIVEYFAKFGVLYVGEIYILPRLYASSNLPRKQWRREIEDFLEKLSLPLTVDLKAWGWQPPYDTPQVRAFFDRRPSAILKPLPEIGLTQTNRRIYATIRRCLGFQHAGELFSESFRETLLDFERLRRALDPAVGLHAGMWIPDWIPSREA